MYKIKQTEEDFKVIEAINLEVKDRGDFVYFWLTKKGYSTVPIINRIADYLKMKPGRIGFAGAKDKKAFTKQAISIKDPFKKITKDTFNNFNSDRFRLDYIGRGTQHIALGGLAGNRFEIIIESDKPPEKVDWFVNYFDDQRFSINNHIVGKAIMKKDWKTAATEVIAEEVKGALSNNPTDFVGAFRRIPLKIRLMYVHAFQSLLWNQTAEAYLESKYKDFITRRYTIGDLKFPLTALEDRDFKKKIPILGFGTEYVDPEVKVIAKKILEDNDVTERDFIVPSMPELSCDGGERKLFIKIQDLDIETLEENRYCLSFFLPSGCYATMALKRIFGD